MKHKNQHFVPESYLKAWCDPSTPDGAYLWMVDKNTRDILRKSPKNIFKEDDFYTVIDTNGNRILELEDRLSEVEGQFAELRRKKLERNKPLTPKDRRLIAIFAATMFARTNIQKKDLKGNWEQLLDSIENLPMNISRHLKKTKEYQNITQLSQQPMPLHMFYFVN